MRIGTWNLAGRWTDEHRTLMNESDCDVWLLTEVSDRLSMDGYELHLSQGLMAQGRRWAAVLSRSPLVPAIDSHPASAMAKVGGLTFCSSVLPWRSCGSKLPWVGAHHADKTEATLDELDRTLPRSALVWGGDWNHALSGGEYAGSAGGRAHLLRFLHGRGMSVPTAPLPHHIDGLLTIDHIAHTDDLASQDATRVSSRTPDGRRLSDHDGYVVTFPQV
jgi:hypothetical protein